MMQCLKSVFVTEVHELYIYIYNLKAPKYLERVIVEWDHDTSVFSMCRSLHNAIAQRQC